MSELADLLAAYQLAISRAYEADEALKQAREAYEKAWKEAVAK